jgi:large subunit ribosomal protein L31/Ran GTPase-activating protein 1
MLKRRWVAGVALRRLDLSDNPMTAEVAPALAETLLRHPDLVALNLNDTSLTDDGVSAIAQALHASADSLQVQQKFAQFPCLDIPDGMAAAAMSPMFCAYEAGPTRDTV